MIYIISAVFSVVVSCFISKSNDAILGFSGFKISIDKKCFRRKIMIFISMILPMSVSAFRYGIGTDYFYTYVPGFRDIALGNRGYYEIGFYWINKIVAMFTDNEQWLIAVTSVIFVGLAYRQIYRMSVNYPISITLLFLSFTYFVSLNNIRQSLALVLLLVAMECLYNKRKIWFIAFTLLAGSIHQVALSFLVMVVSEWVSLSAVTFLGISVSFFGIAKVIAPKIMGVLVPYIPRLALYFKVSELARYNNKTLGSSFVFSHLVIMILLVCIDIMYKPEKSSLNDTDKIEWNITKMNQCLLICICAMDGLVPAAYRIVRVFSFAQFILLPNVILKHANKNKYRLLYSGGVIGIFLMYFMQNLANGTEEVFPYVSIFNH